MADDKETESPQPPAKQPRLSTADTSAGKYTRWQYVRSILARLVKAAGSGS